MRLNLGCGSDVKAGYINVDYSAGVGVDMIHDLNEPLPFEDDSVDEIYCSHALEHLKNRFSFVVECHRVLKKDGVLKVFLPIAAITLDHQSYTCRKDFFNSVTQDKKCSNESNNYFTLQKQRPHLRRVVTLYYRFRDWLINLFMDEWEYVLRKN